MTKKPNILAISTKGDAARASKTDASIGTKIDLAKEIPNVSDAPKPVAGKPLPKVTLYAHPDVLKAIRHVAAEEGVMAQKVLRDAVQAYLDKKGYTFTDLATGAKA